MSTLKIVVYEEGSAAVAKRVFEEFKTADEMSQKIAAVDSIANEGKSSASYDFFLSYSHQDAEAAQYVVEQIRAKAPLAKVFYDRTSLQHGSHWLMDIAESLDVARRVIAIYTPSYWKSEYCKSELTAALVRHIDTGKEVLFPIYYKEANIPNLIRNYQFHDCREGDRQKLEHACSILCNQPVETVWN